MKASLTERVAAIKPERRTVPYKDFGCVLHKSHRPVPNRVELHHRFPLYLQKRIGEEAVSDKERVPMCEGGHSDVHIAINALLLEAPMPKGIGRAEKREANEAVRRFRAAGGTV